MVELARRAGKGGGGGRDVPELRKCGAGEEGFCFWVVQKTQWATNTGRPWDSSQMVFVRAQKQRPVMEMIIGMGSG